MNKYQLKLKVKELLAAYKQVARATFDLCQTTHCGQCSFKGDECPYSILLKINKMKGRISRKMEKEEGRKGE